MTEINHIPDVEPTEDLARQLNSLLAAQLGHAGDPAAALTLMLAALEARVQLPHAQARIEALESEMQALSAKIPPLEASLAESHRFEMQLARATGVENRDAIFGAAVAGIRTQQLIVPELSQRIEAQNKELAELKTKYAEFDPTMVIFAEAIGKADGAEIARVAREALDARRERDVTQARLAGVERERSLEKLDTIIARGKEEHRLTFAVETNIRAGFAAGTLTLEAVNLMCTAMPPIEALKHKYPAPPGSHHDVPIKWNDKTWDQLKPAERAKLHQDEPTIYDQMRNQAMKASGGRVVPPSLEE